MNPPANGPGCAAAFVLGPYLNEVDRRRRRIVVKAELKGGDGVLDAILLHRILDAGKIAFIEGVDAVVDRLRRIAGECEPFGGAGPEMAVVRDLGGKGFAPDADLEAGTGEVGKGVAVVQSGVHHGLGIHAHGRVDHGVPDGSIDQVPRPGAVFPAAARVRGG